MAKIRCAECGCLNDYVMKKINRHYEGDGYDFYLDVEVPICNKCGEEIYVESIEDDIVDRANYIIRKSRDIIGKDEIIEILSKYDVSQKFMSRMLGWGEITLTRYISAGYTPNKTNSDKLRSLNDPYEVQSIMYDKIEETEGEILKESAFIKLQKSVNKNIESLEKNEGKIYRVVNWFLSKSTEEKPMTHLALQKLLYIAQGWNRAINGTWLFENECEAWVHGAVYREIFEKFKKFKYHPLPIVNMDIMLSKAEEIVLESVYRDYFEMYTATALEKICHLEKPYIESRKGCLPEDRCKNIISKKLIESYYCDIAKKYNISIDNLDNMKLYIRELLA